MAKVLLLGAGFVTGPLVEYLLRQKHQLIIGSQFLHEAQKLCAGRPGLKPLQVNVMDQQELNALVGQVDLVVSFVPFQFHVAVARVCIEQKKSLVTASYTHQDMWGLDSAAKKAGITLLNEIGVDPGIDHMTAMQVIDEAHANGQQVEALISWCGGIPAPEANNNPLGYKFSWSPMAVLTAVSNDAKYLSQGAEKFISGESLLGSMRDVTLTNELELKGYANRDSLSYVEQYQIPEVRTLLRGTLRYAGFGSTIDAAKSINLLSSVPFTDTKPSTWQGLMDLCANNNLENFKRIFASEAVRDAYQWLGCFSAELIDGNSPIEAFCSLLANKLKYEKNEQDMIVMQHRMVLVDKQGNKQFHRSTLVEKGDVGGFSAMAKTVGYPAAIAADLILKGKINRKGVCIPVTKDIYQPVLAELETLNIKMTHKIVTDQVEASFLNRL